MKFLIFCLLVSFCLCDEMRYFRFRNGTFIKGNKNPATVSGTLYYAKLSPSFISVYFYGMDYSTMTLAYLDTEYKATLTTNSELDLDCFKARDGVENFEFLSGKAHLRFNSDGCEFSAECYTETGDLWVFKSSNVETKKKYYSPKEAGSRAKFLIGQPKSKYKPQDVITFAIQDDPYFYKSCFSFLGFGLSDAPGPEPGAIMVGPFGMHCAILDNKGTKFIHTNPVTGKVTYESIAVAKIYFPSGIVYKRHPDY